MAILESLIIQSVAHNCAQIVTKKAPLILMTVGIGGMGASTAMAVSVTPKANAIYKQIMRTPNLTPNERNKEIFKRVVPLYAPAALTAVGGATCIVGSYSINMARLAELGAAYALAQNNLTTYRKQIEEKYGKEEEEKINEEVREQSIRRFNEDLKADTRPLMLSNEPNERIFKDMLTKQYFKCRESKIINTVLDINRRIQYEGHIPYTDYALEVNMEACDATDTNGWLMGDEIFVTISEEEYTHPSGWKYREVYIDRNPRFKDYLEKGEFM